MTAHPDFCCKGNTFFCLFDLRGSLAMADFSSTTHIDIWAVNDYEMKEWVREHSWHKLKCVETQDYRIGWLEYIYKDSFIGKWVVLGSMAC